MLRIRLRRVGKKGKPSYRIVVAEASAPRDGAYVEWIGNYDPLTDPPSYSIKTDRAEEWLRKGAQPSDAVRRILDWSATAVADSSDGEPTEPGEAISEAEDSAADNVAVGDGSSESSEDESSAT